MNSWFRTNRTAAWSFVVILLTMFLIGAANIFYSQSLANRQRAESRVSEQRWCDVLETLNSAYSQAPPQTPTGQTLARQIRQLYVESGCQNR